MLNQCNFIGRLGRDPEARYTAGGDPVCNFSLACSETWKDKSGNKQEKTEWVNVVIWGKLAEIATQYLVKGSLCYISGKMQTRKWQDQAGTDKYTTEINAKEMKMLSARSESSGAQQNEDKYVSPPTEKDVPFN